jgi:hypothetical protein
VIPQGPYPLADGSVLTLSQPESFQLAVKLINSSPFQLTVSSGSKSYIIPPLVQDLIDIPSTVQSIVVIATSLTGTIPSGSNSDLTAVWYDANDDVTSLKHNHPITLTANSVSSGSTVTGNVEITSPLNSEGYLEVAPTGALAPTGTANIVALSGSTSSQLLATPTDALSLIFSNSSNETVFIAYGSAAALDNFTFVLASDDNFVQSPAFNGSIYAVWGTAPTSGILTMTALL